MGIVIGLDDRQFELSGDEIVIGRGTSAQLSLPNHPQLDERHAVLRLVAGRWLIESLGEHTLLIGDGRPVRYGWLSEGDVIRLTESGPSLTFQPIRKTPSADLAAELQRRSEKRDLEHVSRATIAKSKSEFPEPTQRFNGWYAVGATAGVVLVGLFCVLFAYKWGPTSASNLHVDATVAVIREPDQLHSIPTGSAEIVEESARHLESTPTINHSVKTNNGNFPAEQASAAVYQVTVSSPDSEQTYRLGTAFAIDRRTIVTSGAVAQGIQQLRKQLPHAAITGPSDNAHATITDIRIHPEYLRIEQTIASTQTAFERLQSDREQRNTPTTAPVEDEEAEFQRRLNDAFREQVDFDVAVLSVDTDLPSFLTIPATTPALRAGQTVFLVGLPFPIDEYMIDPDAASTVQVASSQIQNRIGGVASEVRRWIVKVRGDRASDNWSGTPAINLQGEVIGIYSRPTPPLKLDRETTPSTHEITGIARLREIEGGAR